MRGGVDKGDAVDVGHATVEILDPDNGAVLGQRLLDQGPGRSGTVIHHREGPDTEFVPDVLVADGDRFAVGTGDGACTIEVVHTPGHTSNHVCFALVEERTLFTGDHVMGWATSVISPPDGDLYDYMNSLRKLLDRDDERYWPTHGPAIENPKEYVQAFVDHRLEREAQIVAGLQPGPSTIKDLVPGMYAEVDKRLWRAAANSVYSHLLALHREGRVVVDVGEPSITATWRLL